METKGDFIEEHSTANRVKYNTLSILFIAIVGLSWFMNIGWIRVIYILPMLIHAIVFYLSNSSYHRNKNIASKNMNIVNRLVYITYLFCNVLLPDGGDTADSVRVFFGFITNDLFINIASVVSEVLLIVNLVLIIIQIIYTMTVKLDIKDEMI